MSRVKMWRTLIQKRKESRIKNYVIIEVQLQ